MRSMKKQNRTFKIENKKLKIQNYSPVLSLCCFRGCLVFCVSRQMPVYKRVSFFDFYCSGEGNLRGASFTKISRQGRGAGISLRKNHCAYEWNHFRKHAHGGDSRACF